jgi:hypothetical protein
MSTGSWTPKGQQTFGAARPDARRAKLPAGLSVRRAGSIDTKISCVVISSPSIPITSVMADAFLVPSESRDLNDQIYRRCNLLAHRAIRQVEVGHRDHRVRR